MHFIDIDWFFEMSASLAQPFAILKVIAIGISNDGSRSRTKFHAEPVRVAVVDKFHIGEMFGINAVFIHHPGDGIWNDASIYAAGMSLFHGNFFPAVALINQRYFFSIGGKGAEANAAVFLYMCTKKSIGIKRIA